MTINMVSADNNIAHQIDVLNTKDHSVALITNESGIFSLTFNMKTLFSDYNSTEMTNVDSRGYVSHNRKLQITINKQLGDVMVDFMTFFNSITGTTHDYPTSALNTTDCATLVPIDTDIELSLNVSDGMVNFYEIISNGYSLSNTSANGSSTVLVKVPVCFTNIIHSMNNCIPLDFQRSIKHHNSCS